MKPYKLSFSTHLWIMQTSRDQRTCKFNFHKINLDMFVFDTRNDVTVTYLDRLQIHNMILGETLHSAATVVGSKMSPSGGNWAKTIEARNFYYNIWAMSQNHVGGLYPKGATKAAIDWLTKTWQLPLLKLRHVATINWSNLWHGWLGLIDWLTLAMNQKKS